MTAAHPRTLTPAAVVWDDGVPTAPEYGDVYFSRHDGVTESATVFITGNDLPARFRDGCGALCIAELGFGTGLNFALARQTFLDHARPGDRLTFVSFERHPLPVADRSRLAGQIAPTHPALAGMLDDLNACAPPALMGWHRLQFDGGRVQLALYYGSAEAGLDDWLATLPGGVVDAWFLDGFAPKRNESLWAPSLFAKLPRLSRPGATLATFSVAAAVRQGLEQAGFEVTRVDGPPGKRQVLRGRLQPGLGRAALDRPAQVRVIGAGLAGACCAAALASRGIEVEVQDPLGAGAAAAANPWAVMHPRLPLDDGPRGPLFATAFAGSRSWLAAHAADCWQPRTVLQLPELRRPGRLKDVLQRYLPSGPWLAADQLGGLTAIRFDGAGWADLGRLVRRLLEHPLITLSPQGFEGPLQASAQGPVVVAAGVHSAEVLPSRPPLGRMRGQLTRTRQSMAPDAVTWPIVTGRGHALALADGWVCGASYVRDGDAEAASAGERAENLGRLKHLQDLLAATQDAGEVCAEFVGLRCTVPDRVPLLGPWREMPGLYVSTGHASAGLLTCPLAAELIAAAICGEAPVLDAELRALLRPDRF
ncbi:MAG: tRNA (5-methylaminomethyl-2-thiouridine)(34)-methyltransferase MnmD [Gammaproteobacteria bacterium]|nr:tRNA (5-methylaminomethyl-2-thiouridine)(34)-methyltransferase MnmD [Gammaproteobacteria bacterium]